MAAPGFRASLLAALFAAIALSGCAEEPEPVVVEMHNGRFSPDTLTVASGTKILLRNVSPATHTWTVNFASGNIDDELGPGDEQTMVFSTPRVYDGGCRFHPEMRFRLEVT